MEPMRKISKPGDGTKGRTDIVKAQLTLRKHELFNGTPLPQPSKNKKHSTTLFSILSVCIGAHLTIDLKNENVIRGTVEYYELPKGDIHLSNVHETNGRDGSVATSEFTVVRGNTVRYVHLPADLNVMERMGTLADLRGGAKSRVGRLDVLSGHNDGTIKEILLN